jgi:acetolactate synthase-1/2/3 large subunit
VVLALPEDTLFAEAAVATCRATTRASCASALEVEKASELLSVQKRPFVIVGGSGWTGEACRKLQRWIEKSGCRLGTSFRCQDLFDNRSPSYAGDVGIGINPKLAQRVKEADVLLVIGARLGEMTTSAYTLVEAPVPQADADPRPRRCRGARAGVPRGAADQLRLSAVRRCACKSSLSPMRSGKPRPRPRARNTSSGPSRGRCRASSNTASSCAGCPIAARGRDHCGRRGQLRGLAASPFRYKGFRTQLGPTNGSMGYGYPAAVAAKLASPRVP